MKKLFALALSIVLFLGMTEGVQAKSVTFTKGKKDSLLNYVSEHTTMHYTSYITLQNGEGSGIKGKSYASLDTGKGLISMKSYLNVTNKTPDGDYVYDYKRKKLHVKKSMGAMVDQANEGALQKVIPFEQTTLKDIFENVFNQHGIKEGIKGKASKGKEVYQIRLKEVNGVPKQFLEKCTVKFTVKKSGGKYIPVQLAAKIDTKINNIKSSSSSVIVYRKFDNKPLSVPK